jgi:PKD repeat protein
MAYGIPPVDPIAYPKKSVVCGSETPRFVGKATNANRYGWLFGDGTTAVTSDTGIGHKYSTLGTKRVTVIPSFNGCPGPATSFTIEVIGVISKFNYANTCADRKTYAFTDSSLGKVSSYVWDFGDGSPNEFIPSPRHTYPDTGSFKTSLTVTDSITGCVDVYEQTIYTANPQLLNPDSSICKYARSSFQVLDTYSDSAATYTWNVLGTQYGPLPADLIAAKAGVLGNFNNFVTIKYGRNSCPDTVRMDHSILVRDRS